MKKLEYTMERKVIRQDFHKHDRKTLQKEKKHSEQCNLQQKTVECAQRRECNSRLKRNGNHSLRQGIKQKQRNTQDQTQEQTQKNTNGLNWCMARSKGQHASSNIDQVSAHTHDSSVT